MRVGRRPGAPPGWEQGWGAAWQPPPRRRRWPFVVVGIVAVVGLAAGAVAVMSGGRDHPDEWDERVAPLAAFVERERGLSFEHPVTVEFLTEDEYSAAARTDEAALSDDDKALLDEWGAMFAALGLVPEGTDLFDTANEMADAGTLAFYDPATERVTVRGTEMSTGLAVTLVHELVHVAQDQAFDLEQPPPNGDSSGAYDAYDALIEGDASRIELAYLATLSEAEQTAFWDQYDADFEASQDELEGVPGALQALFAAPYVLGQPLVEIVAGGGGNAAVDDAFGDPPASGEHLFDPRSYLDGDAPIRVDDPDLPSGAEAVGLADELGATTLFVLLSERIDPVQALTAADGWGGDRYAAYRLDGRTCVQVDLVGDTPTDTGEIGAALEAWAAAGPAGAASVDTSGERVGLESCAAPADPGAAAGRSYDALGLPAARAQLMATATAEGRSHDDAFAVGDCFVRAVPLETLTAANESAEPPSEVIDAVTECMSR